MVPVRRAALLGLATAVSSRAVLAVTCAWGVVLAAVYAADAGPPLPALAFTAVALLPIAAWATAAHLGATSRDLRQVLTAADGRGRVLLADALPPLGWLVAATAAGVAANWLFDPHPASVAERLLGALLHLELGAVGGALALVLHTTGLTRGVQGLVFLVGTGVSARLAWLPPAGPVLSTWGAGRAPGAGAAAWALGAPVVLVAALVVLTLQLRRHR